LKHLINKLVTGGRRLLGEARGSEDGPQYKKSSDATDFGTE
jgi:hypothetical protein